MTLRTAVIGVGHLGEQHARIHAALAAEGVSQFTSVCDLDAERLKRVANEWQTHSTTDWRTLLGHVDAVSLAVPTESHSEIACGLLESGIHVLVEKPISRTIEEADRMIGLGLATDLRKLLKLLPETRQTLMFTMTMPPELNRLAKEALVEPVRVDLAHAGKSGTGITQAIYPVPRDLKSDLLTELLSRQEVSASTFAICSSRRFQTAEAASSSGPSMRFFALLMRDSAARG